MSEKFVVSNLKIEHNHEVNSEIFKTLYHENRITEEIKNTDLSEFVNLEPKPKKLREELSKIFNVFLTSKDCNNIIQKNKSIKDSLNDQLNNFANSFNQENNIFEVTHDSNKNLKSIYFQLKEAVEIYERFPNLLLLDATYKVNNLDMPLLVFMNVDALTCDKIIACALVESETTEILSDVLNTFKKYNPTSKNLSYIIVDKSMAEISAIKIVFPDCSIRLCSFHVIQAF